MVKRTCEVLSCSQEVTSSVSLHQVPRNGNEADRLWIRFLKQANREFNAWKPTKKNIFICSGHFRNTDFRVGTTGKKFIVDGCYPCILNGTDVSENILMENGDEKESHSSPTQPEFEIEVHQDSNKVSISKSDDHAKCEEVIQSQVKCIDKLKHQIFLLTQEIASLKNENEQLRRKTIRSLQKKLNRRDEQLKRKCDAIEDLKEETKKAKQYIQLPEPATQADPILLELIERRNVPHSRPYSTAMKSFAFNCHYISPKGYSYLRQMFPSILPSPVNCYRWTKDVAVKPGILSQSLHEIATTCSGKEMYYSLAFDEVAIRQQIIFDGKGMQGTIDFGGLAVEGPKKLAKSALFCLATEINGTKSFPIAYLLTDGLKSDVIAEVVQQCIKSVESVNGNVLSISFDGLRANFSAMEKLGACLNIESENFQPFIKNAISKKSYLIPDAAHMFKLARNTLEKYVLFNNNNKEIKWEYIAKLHEVQEREELRAANKLTSRHVNFHQKKMNVKLCVQVLSDRTAAGIDFCRSIGMDGFEGSEATTEFLRINNFTFDLLNTRPFGHDCNEPLSAKNEMKWSTIIFSAKKYYTGLQIRVGRKLIPVHQSKNGTFVKGIITALSSIECIMKKIMEKETILKYLPTYRLSQDPLEVFFGGLRRRLGCNDNPNVIQLAYTVKAMLCFKLATCKNGNCEPQEDLIDKLSTASLSELYTEPLHENEDEVFDDMHFDTELQLSLFVENIVVYIAGFVGKRLNERSHCSECLSCLTSDGDGDILMREDFTLLLQRDRGGLFKPSEDLVRVCKICEKNIRIEQSGGVFNLDVKRLEWLVKRDCIGKNLFSTLHRKYSCSVFQQALFDLHSTHKLSLISEICRTYSKIRLHYIAKRSSLLAKPVTNRNTLNNLVQFNGF